MKNMKELIREINNVKNYKISSKSFLEDIKQFIDLIFNSIQDGISILDTNYTILEVNQIMKKWYIESGNIINRKCYEVYHKRDRVCVECPAKKAIFEKRMVKGIVPFDEKGIPKGWQELYCFPLYSENGDVLGIIEYVRDITKIKKTEEVIKKLEKRLRFKEKSLKEKHMALKVLLQARSYEKEVFAEDLIRQYNVTVIPILEYLKRSLINSDEYDTIINLEKTLNELFSTATQTLNSYHPNLTRRESQVAHLIMLGKSTKDIAKILGISVKAVDFHRYNIRKKLFLTDVKISLQDYLLKGLKY